MSLSVERPTLIVEFPAGCRVPSRCTIAPKAARAGLAREVIDDEWLRRWCDDWRGKISWRRGGTSGCDSSTGQLAVRVLQDCCRFWFWEGATSTSGSVQFGFFVALLTGDRRRDAETTGVESASVVKATLTAVALSLHLGCMRWLRSELFAGLSSSASAALSGSERAMVKWSADPSAAESMSTLSSIARRRRRPISSGRRVEELRRRATENRDVRIREFGSRASHGVRSPARRMGGSVGVEVVTSLNPDFVWPSVSVVMPVRNEAQHISVAFRLCWRRTKVTLIFVLRLRPLMPQPRTW